MDFFKPPQAKAQGGFTFDVEHDINFAKKQTPNHRFNGKEHMRV